MKYRAVALAVAILVAVEMGLARQEWLWGWVPRSPSGVADIIDAQVDALRHPPTVVLLGSSRVRDAVAPRELEASLSLRDGDVVNLGMTAGGPLDALSTYRRHRVTLAKAQLLVVGVEDWWLDGAKPPAERELRRASLRERMVSGFAPRDRLGLVVGWLWRTYDARDPLKRFLGTLAGKPRRPVVVGDDGRIIWRDGDEAKATDAGVQAWVHKVYRSFYVDQARLAPLDELIRLAREDGLRVLIIQVPLSDAYLRLVKEHYGDQYRAYRELIIARAVEGAIAVQIFEEGSAIGLRETDFFDYGHLNPSGAERATEVIAQVITPILGTRASRQ